MSAKRGVTEDRGSALDIRKTTFYEELVRHPEFDMELPVDAAPLAWSYASPEAPGLVELRDRYGLGGLTEGRSELDAILGLLDWAHRIVEHDGGAQNPEPRNALNILSTCAATGARVNCRMKAIVLNEAYLAMGLRSRYITCLPAVDDGDCHVTVMVYSSTLRKWLLVDPTQNTFFTSDDGTILNIIEARGAYRSGRSPRFRSIDRPVSGPMVCGGMECATYDEFYAVYMCKNCFRFACTLSSEPGIDSRRDEPTVVLTPPGDEWATGDEPARWGVPVVVTHNATAFLA